MKRKQIERKAWMLLEKYDAASVPVKLSTLADHIGVGLVLETDLEDDVSGLLLVNAGTATIIVNGNHHPHRQRFTIAHELGHLQLHALAKQEVLFVDKAFYRNGHSSKGIDQQEIEANAFAAALLMPEKLISAELPQTRISDLDILRLATRFRVSEQAMALRLARLNRIET